jgi:hypothetical protein
MRCCEEALAHCHGVLVRHADGRCECIEDPGCGAGAPAHDWAVGCAEVGCPCGADDEGVVLLAA